MTVLNRRLQTIIRCLPRVGKIGMAAEIGGRIYTEADFCWQEESAAVLRGSADGISALWEMRPTESGVIFGLEVLTAAPCIVKKLTPVCLTYTPLQPLEELRMIRRAQNRSAAQIGTADVHSSFLHGVFGDAHLPGIMLSTIVPQEHRHEYDIALSDGETLRFYADTIYPCSYEPRCRSVSERSFITTADTAIAAFECLKRLHAGPKGERVLGWNSWDYYFCTVTPDDLVENMEEIKRDPVLNEHLDTFWIDMGWAHDWGEWFVNYKFGHTLAPIVREMKARGFHPGVWIAPMRLEPLCAFALRHPDALIHDEYGDPLTDSEGYYIVDPTHPEGKAHIHDAFERLKDWGFTHYKIDFLSELCAARYFYDRNCGVYGAIRAMMQEIRGITGEDAYLLGCSMPFECGAGLCDSARIGIDIHSQWEHVKWSVESLQNIFWVHDSFRTGDMDFLIVRGPQTDRQDPQRNVLNPKLHNPNPPRWRRGSDFTQIEAQTWANLVYMSGGNIVLSDRLSMLNDQGKHIIHDVLSRPQWTNASIPLDVLTKDYPCFWYRSQGNAHQLLVINWNDQEETLIWNDAAYGLSTGKQVALTLPAHGSQWIAWEE